MDAVGRFKFLKRKIRQKLGTRPMSREVAHHLEHAASIQQILEVARHAMFLGHQLDAASLAALRDELPLELARATIAASETQISKLKGTTT